LVAVVVISSINNIFFFWEFYACITAFKQREVSVQIAFPRSIVVNDKSWDSSDVYCAQWMLWICS
jgi:hypothetical protein